jgi:hypothetical protein
MISAASAAGCDLQVNDNHNKITGMKENCYNLIVTIYFKEIAVQRNPQLGKVRQDLPTS